MDFMQSQTIENLARAFAGECQAYMRYSFYADQAVKENYNNIAVIFEKIACNEKAHSKVFYDLIIGHSSEPINNININSGYPFKFGNTEFNISSSILAENAESTEIYPVYADVAQKEGFADAEKAFTLVAQVEKKHSNVLTNVYNLLSQNTLYASSFPSVWTCSACGHSQSMDSPWTECPLCGNSQGFTEINTN